MAKIVYKLDETHIKLLCVDDVELAKIYLKENAGNKMVVAKILRSNGFPAGDCLAIAAECTKDKHELREE